MTAGTVAVAVSGGVDSTTAAHLLARSGLQVFGLHFVTGFEPAPDDDERMRQARRRVQALADMLAMRVHLVDLRRPFARCVIEPFVAAYARARTPNPCMVCNRRIKFGLLLEAARSRGAEALATGHYARSQTAADGRPALFKGADVKKDQSYFLARLTPAQLAAARFPLGQMTKEQVRHLAATAGLVPLQAQESQDACFLAGTSYRRLLERRPGFLGYPGPIVDLDGKIIGHHLGLYRYTIGQRRGINVPAKQPYYVVAMDADTNRLVVGPKQATYTTACRVEQINWLVAPPQQPFSCTVRVRYRHREAEARVEPLAADEARVVFSRPQSAVTPGQGAVFYDGQRVLGGGWIR